MFNGLTKELLTKIAQGGSPARTAAPEQRLTPREQQILRLIGIGRANREIAVELGMSTKTVETHRRHIKVKLGLASSTELVRYAITNAAGQSDPAAS